MGLVVGFTWKMLGETHGTMVHMPIPASDALPESNWDIKLVIHQPYPQLNTIKLLKDIPPYFVAPLQGQQIWYVQCCLCVNNQMTYPHKCFPLQPNMIQSSL